MVFRFSTDRWVPALLGVALLTAASVAQANPAADADAELRRGVALRRGGKDAEALEAFQHALSLAPTPRALAQIALAEQALSLWLPAERDLSLALAHADDTWIKQNQEVLESAKRGVEARLAWMIVRTNVPEAIVTWNGTPAVADTDHRVRIVAGQVYLDVRADGYQPFAKALRIAPETTEQLDVELVPTAPISRAPVAAAPAPPPSSVRRLAGFVVAGVGVVALGAGGVFGAIALGRKGERDDDCAGGCSQIGLDADRAGRSAGLISTVAFVAGAASVATGLVLVLGAPTAARAPRSALRLQVAGPALALAGSF